MLQVKSMTVGLLHTNCYLVAGEGSSTCVVIDPGTLPTEIANAAADWGKTVEAIFLTHGHFDHVGGVKKLAKATGCRVYLCRKELALPGKLTAGELYSTDFYREGDVISAAGTTFTVLETPGHTPGSVCLQAENYLFTGDTLFAGTCGRTDLDGSSWTQMEASLRRLREMTRDAIVCPGHGRESTLLQEQQTNPCLQQ